MTPRESVLYAYSSIGMSQSDAAERLGISRQALYSRLNEKDMPVGTLCSLLSLAGYSLVALSPAGEGVEVDG